MELPLAQTQAVKQIKKLDGRVRFGSYHSSFVLNPTNINRTKLTSPYKVSTTNKKESDFSGLKNKGVFKAASKKTSFKMPTLGKVLSSKSLKSIR